METRQATVNKVRSRNDSGWTVLTMDDRTAWVGVFEEAVQYGDTIQASGEATVHPKFGAQFKVEQVINVLPKSTDGQLAWLASELPSIGPAKAQKLVDTFGERLWDVLAIGGPELAEAVGGPVNAAEIATAYRATAASKEVVSKLVDLGLSVTDAKRVWKTLGATTMSLLDEDPYELMEVSRITFEKADLVARRYGLDASDPRRALGYAKHLLLEEAGKGHCFVHAESLFIALRAICPEPEKAVFASKRFHVDEEGRAWLWSYFNAECVIAEWVKNDNG